MVVGRTFGGQNDAAGKSIPQDYTTKVVDSLMKDFAQNLPGVYSSRSFSSEPAAFAGQKNAMRNCAVALYQDLRNQVMNSERGIKTENEKRRELRWNYRGIAKHVLDNGGFDKTTVLVAAALAAKTILDGKENFRDEHISIAVEELVLFVHAKVGAAAAEHVTNMLKREYPKLKLERAELLQSQQRLQDQYGPVKDWRERYGRFER